MEVDKYLERIGYIGRLQPNIKCLRKLHEAHIMSIPFEALDVELGNEIILDLDLIFEKVVYRKRGGYCYELNYLFNWLLRTIGFECYMISARIYDQEELGPENDHMAIIAKLDKMWLVDVGYGDLFLRPLQLESRLKQKDTFKWYLIKGVRPSEYILTESLHESHGYIRKYKFDTTPKEINQFEEQNQFKQFSPESYFVKNRICTIATKKGRKTIFNDIYKDKTREHYSQLKIESNEDLHKILVDQFNISISIGDQ